MIEIDDKDREKIEMLINLTNITTSQVYQMECMIRKYIDHGVKICGTCPAQIRFGHQRLCQWYEKYK